MRKMLVAVAAGLVAMGLASADVSAKSRVKVGVLSCGMEPGVGLIVVSQKRMSCVYQPSKGGRVERYRGKITRIGLDIGVTNQTVLVWGVFAPARPKRGALEGSYGGVSAEATLVVGVGANALLGGFKRSIMLQPLSVQAQTGLDIAAGIAGMRLDYVK
jgi:hypothetical protein